MKIHLLRTSATPASASDASSKEPFPLRRLLTHRAEALDVLPTACREVFDDDDLARALKRRFRAR